jgi:replicative DNA helicase
MKVGSLPSLRYDVLMEGRLPPHNLDAEVSLLGSVLLDSTVYETLEGLIAPEAFYKEAHRRIWEAMARLRDHREPVDLVTLSEQLRRAGELENIGGLTYLIALSEATPSAAHADHYGRIVAEKWALRRLISAAGETIRMAHNQEGSLEEILDTAGRRVLEVSTQGARVEFQQMRELVHETFGQIQQAVDNKGQPAGIKTGFRELDSMIGGLAPGSLNIIAARPSMGKTAWALTIAQNAALRDGVPVAIFSLEMPAVQLTTRMLCSEARVDMNRLRQGQLTNHDFSRMVEVAGRISEAAILIDDSSDLTLMELRARARRLHAQHRLGLIVIDYLQLMSGSNNGKSSGENRQQEIAQISRGLKGLARELEVPVIALSQLSRAVEARPNKRPMLSDLRESGSLEQDADLVMFIYRDDYYNPHSEKAGIAEIIVGKQRNGPIGAVEVQFHAQHVRFNELARDC